MSTNSLAAGLILGGLVSCGLCSAQNQDTPNQAPAAESKTRLDIAGAEMRIVDAANEFRREQGRGQLKVNPELAKAAHYFANYMAETDKFSHTADGHEPWDRAKKYGYDYCIVEENIAFEFNSDGFTTPRLAKGFLDGWKKSPGHRRNLLNPDVDETGVGVARSSNSGKYYAVQMFGRPKSEAIRFSVTNQTDAEVTYSVDGHSYKLEPRSTMTHEVCAPPSLTMGPTGQEKPEAERGRALHPHAGSHFVIEQSGSGKPAIREE